MSRTERHRDGRRTPGRRAWTLACAAKAAALLAGGVAHGGLIDANGGNSANGCASVAKARAAGAWAPGSTACHDGNRSMFALDSGHADGGTRIADGSVAGGAGYTGDTRDGALRGSREPVDQAIGLDLRFEGTGHLGLLFVHVDWEGDEVQASTVSKDDGVDATTSPTAGSPAVRENGGTGDAIGVRRSIGLDAVERGNGGLRCSKSPLGAAINLGFSEAGPGGFSHSERILGFPTPGAVALCGLAALVPTRRGKPRRR